MLTKSALAKITKNYANSYLKKSAQNTQKQIESLKDEKAITLILHAIEEACYLLEEHHGKKVYYELSTHRMNAANLNTLLMLSFKIPNSDNLDFIVLEELDGQEVCMNYFAKNYNLVLVKDSFEVKIKEQNFLSLGNKLLGKELTEQLLISLIEHQYHV